MRPSSRTGVLVASADQAFASRLCDALAQRGYAPTTVAMLDEQHEAAIGPSQPIVFVDVDSAESLGGRLLLCGRPAGLATWYVAVTRQWNPSRWRALVDAGYHDLLLNAPGFPDLDVRLAVARSRIGTDDVHGWNATMGHVADGRRFHAIFDCAALAIAVIDLKGRIIDCNRHLAALFGYAAEDLCGKCIQDFIYSEDIEKDRERTSRFVAGEYSTLVTERRYVRHDGSVLWGRAFASLIGNGHDKPAYAICMVEDISGRRLAEQARTQAENALRERETQYRLLAENASDIVWTIAFDRPLVCGEPIDAARSRELAAEVASHSSFSYMSPSVERTFGFRVAEALLATPLKLLSPQSQEIWIDFLAETICRGESVSKTPASQRQLTVEIRTKAGGYRWCEMNVSFLRDEEGRPIGILGATRDTTERKAAADALRASEATLRRLVENSPNFVVVVGLDSVVRYANRRWRDVDRRDFIGASILSYMAPEFRDRLKLALQTVMAGNEVGNVELVDRSGLIWVCHFVPMFEGQSVQTVMIICNDVTTRKKAEESLLKEQELLRQMLDLSERERELLAFEIHDGFAQMLTGALLQFESADRLANERPDDARQACETGIRLLRESIQESRRLVSGLHPPVLDSFGVIPAVEMLILEHAEAGSPEIEFVCSAKLDRLARNTENTVFRIIQESLNNVRRHSRSEKIRVQLSHDDRWVRILVQDWGVGFNVENVDPRRFGLRGIRERARLMEGHAIIESAPGQGTTVRVEIPFVRRPPEECEPNVLEDGAEEISPN
jgi:PAS domain S-box-containing protein